MRKFLSILVLMVSIFSMNLAKACQFSEVSCEKYSHNETFAKALTKVAINMKTTPRGLCSLERLFADLVVTAKNCYNTW